MDRRLDFDLRKAHSAKQATAKQLVNHVENCDLCSRKNMLSCDVGVSLVDEWSIASQRYHELKIKEMKNAG